MNPRTAAIGSIIVFGVWIAFNVILIVLGEVEDPWHKPSLYTWGGTGFALLSGGLGLFARICGKETLDPKLKGIALISIIGGASFVASLAMAVITETGGA